MFAFLISGYTPSKGTKGSKPGTFNKKATIVPVRKRSTVGNRVQNQWELLLLKSLNFLYKQKGDNRRLKVAGEYTLVLF